MLISQCGIHKKHKKAIFPFIFVFGFVSFRVSFCVYLQMDWLFFLSILDSLWSSVYVLCVFPNRCHLQTQYNTKNIHNFFSRWWQHVNKMQKHAQTQQILTCWNWLKSWAIFVLFNQFIVAAFFLLFNTFCVY